MNLILKILAFLCCVVGIVLYSNNLGLFECNLVESKASLVCKILSSFNLFSSSKTENNVDLAFDDSVVYDSSVLDDVSVQEINNLDGELLSEEEQNDKLSDKVDYSNVDTSYSSDSLPAKQDNDLENQDVYVPKGIIKMEIESLFGNNKPLSNEIFPALIRKLKSGSPQEQTMALFCLFHITDESNKEQAEEIGAFATLIQLMFTTDVSNFKHANKILLNLGGNRDEFLDMLLANGLEDALISLIEHPKFQRLLMDHVISICSLIEEICFHIHNSADEPPFDYDKLHKILTAFKIYAEKNPIIEENLYRAFLLLRLAGQKRFLDRPMSDEELLELFDSVKKTINPMELLFIYNYLEGERQQVKVLIENGFVDLLNEFLDRGKRLEIPLLCLASIMGHHKDQIKIILDKGFAPKIVPLLDSNIVHIHQMAMEFFAQIYNSGYAEELTEKLTRKEFVEVYKKLAPRRSKTMDKETENYLKQNIHVMHSNEEDE